MTAGLMARQTHRLRLLLRRLHPFWLVRQLHACLLLCVCVVPLLPSRERQQPMQHSSLRSHRQLDSSRLLQTDTRTTWPIRTSR